MELRYVYDPMLRTSLEPVTVFDNELKDQADEMLALMKKENGLGLSANQVGINKRLIVLGYEPENEKDDLPRIPYQVLCNPQVVKSSQEQETMEEGCLSFPGLEIAVTRPVGVTVMAQDILGKPIKIKSKGLYARILQHEIDHTNGILFTDYLKGKMPVPEFCQTLFFGSDDFSLAIYESLKKSGVKIIGVVTETSKPSGRGQRLEDPTIKKHLNGQNVPIFQPEDKLEIVEVVRRMSPHLIVLASYGKILPQAALDLAPYGGVNVHPSLLPKYRGATPIQSALLSGESETGVTLQRMSSKVDQGAMIASDKISITQNEGYIKISQRCAEVGGELLVTTLSRYLAGLIALKVQDEELATQTKKITKELAQINWDLSAWEIHNMIRAYELWPVAFTFFGGKRLLIRESSVVNNLLLPVKVQLEGKKACLWQDFVRGHSKELTDQFWYSKISKEC